MDACLVFSQRALAVVPWQGVCCCFGSQSLRCVLSRASSLLCGFYRPVKEKSLSLAVGTEESRSDCKPQCEVSETVVLPFERSH